MLDYNSLPLQDNLQGKYKEISLWVEYLTRLFFAAHMSFLVKKNKVNVLFKVVLLINIPEEGMGWTPDEKRYTGQN